MFLRWPTCSARSPSPRRSRRSRELTRRPLAPIEDGFVTVLRLTFGKGQLLAPLLDAFVREQRAAHPDPEPELRARYGARPPDDPRFRWIDYPCFDTGSMMLGFGLLHHHQPPGARAMWFWSRFPHAHK